MSNRPRKPNRRAPLTGPILPANPQNVEKVISREGIANLAAACACFEPNLVNENWDGTFKVRHEPAPTFDQFINTAARAIQEVHAFIKHFEETKNNYTTLSKDAGAAYRIAHVAGVHNDSLETTMDLVVGRYNQFLDTLTKLGYEKIRPDHCLEDIGNLQAIAKEIVLRFRPSNNPDNGATSSKTIAFPQQETDVSGTT